MSAFLSMFIALIVAAITYGTPLLFGTLGEILTEKSGNLNLGVEGIMFMGGAKGKAESAVSRSITSVSICTL